MTRHIFDRNREVHEAMRLIRYLRIDRARGPDRAAKIMHRLAKPIRADQRMQQFLRVARGHTA